METLCVQNDEDDDIIVVDEILANTKPVASSNNGVVVELLDDDDDDDDNVVRGERCNKNCSSSTKRLRNDVDDGESLLNSTQSGDQEDDLAVVEEYIGGDSKRLKSDRIIVEYTGLCCKAKAVAEEDVAIVEEVLKIEDDKGVESLDQQEINEEYVRNKLLSKELLFNGAKVKGVSLLLSHQEMQSAKQSKDYALDYLKRHNIKYFDAAMKSGIIIYDGYYLRQFAVVKSSGNYGIKTKDLKDAVDNGDLYAIKELLRYKRLDYDAKIHKIFRLALKKGDSALIVELLEHCDLKDGYEKAGRNTLLHLAAELQDEEIVKLMLKYFANVWVVNKRRQTPLHIAARNQNRKVLDILLHHSSESGDESKYQNITDYEGISLFHIICMGRKSSYVVDFLQHQSQVLLNQTVSSRSSFCPGHTALHFAVSYYRYGTVKILVERGAYLEARTSTGLSLLHLACQMDNLKWMFFELTEDDLLQKSIHSVINCMGYRSMTIKMLLQKRCNVYARDSEGNNVLMCLAKSEYYLCVDEFLRERCMLRKSLYRLMVDVLERELRRTFDEVLEYYRVNSVAKSDGYVINLKNRSGMTCLHHAATINGQSIAQQILFQHDVRMNAVNDYFSSPLHLAAKNYADKLIVSMYAHSKRNLDEMVDVNAQDDSGNTPLHYAYVKHSSDFEDYNCFYLLLRYGTDVTIENEAGSSAASMAVKDVTDIVSSEHFAVVVMAFKNTANNCRREPVQRFMNSEIINKCIDEHKNDLIFAAEFWKHLTKLQVCDYFRNEAYDEFLQLVSKKLHVTETSIRSKMDFISSCEQEVARLKEVRISDSLSLYNVLNQNINKVAGYTNNDKLKRILESRSFTKKYKLYGKMLRARYVRGLVRASLLECAVKSLKNIMQVDISDVYVEKIVSYLSEKKLRDIIEADRPCEKVEVKLDLSECYEPPADVVTISE